MCVCKIFTFYTRFKRFCRTRCLYIFTRKESPRWWRTSSDRWIWFSCLVYRSVATGNVLGNIPLPRNYRSFSRGFHVQQTNRKFHGRQLNRSKDRLRPLRSNSFQVDTRIASTGREYRELHFHLKTRLPTRSLTRSTNARTNAFY